MYFLMVFFERNKKYGKKGEKVNFFFEVNISILQSPLFLSLSLMRVLAF